MILEDQTTGSLDAYGCFGFIPNEASVVGEPRLGERNPARQIFSTREKQHGFCSEKAKFLCENPQTVVLWESGGVKEFKNCPDYQKNVPFIDYSPIYIYRFLRSPEKTFEKIDEIYHRTKSLSLNGWLFIKGNLDI